MDQRRPAQYAQVARYVAAMGSGGSTHAPTTGNAASPPEVRSAIQYPDGLRLSHLDRLKQAIRSHSGSTLILVECFKHIREPALATSLLSPSEGPPVESTSPRCGLSAPPALLEAMHSRLTQKSYTTDFTPSFLGPCQPYSWFLPAAFRLLNASLTFVSCSRPEAQALI